VTVMPTQDPPQEVTTWDARMTTLQGEWVANSKSISWMLHLMQSTAPVDADTARVIQGGLVKNSAEGAEVERHRQFVANAFPDRMQRASVVSRHLHKDIPGLQAALERIGFVMQQANEQQTEILGSMMVGHTETILEAVAGLSAKMVVLTEKVEQSQFSWAGHASIPPSTMQIQHSADSHGFSGLVDEENTDSFSIFVDEENADCSSGFTDTDGDVLPGKYTDFCMTGEDVHGFYDVPPLAYDPINSSSRITLPVSPRKPAVLKMILHWA